VKHSLETLLNCPSCGSPVREEKLCCRDYTYSKELFKIDRCLHCKLLYTNPRPSESNIGCYYGSLEYVSHTDTQKGLLFRLYRIVKNYTLKQKRKHLEKLCLERSILDYGAGSGDFSAELSNHGWNVLAYEPDSSASKLIVEKAKAVLLVDSLPAIADNSVSAIVLWHVLEHVHQLNDTLSEFKRILKPNGHLVIAVPNHLSIDAKAYGSNWAAYDVPRHLYHFDHDSFEILMKKHQFKLSAIKPMWFDSFYVSLLSEKNKRTYRGHNWLIGWPIALVIALVSNFISLFSTKRCSSITYVMQNVK
jgi:2-polyprenyl-3-methyl-5-hydroxy-6-metoxy-1,4-benzoquinol methylase